MNQIYPNNGLIYQLTQTVSGSPLLTYFVNNYTIIDTTILSSLTEVAYAGYARTTLTAGTWTSLGVSGGIGTIAYPTVTFTNGSTGSITLYGYYILDPTGTYLLAGGNFSSAVTLAIAGTYSFTPTWSNKSQY